MEIGGILLIIVLTCVIIFLLYSVIQYNLRKQEIEGFDSTAIETTTGTTTSTTTGPTPNCNVVPDKPQRVRIIRLSDSEFQVHFNYPGPLTCPVNQFIILVSQFTSDMEQVGEIKILVSDESTGSKTAICKSAGTLGGLNCGFEHTFKDIPKLDSNGNNYRYRVGVAAIRGNYISNFVEPANIPLFGNIRLFTMEKDFKLNPNTNTVMSGSNGELISATSNSDFLNEGIDTQYKLLTQQLGGYPYAAFLSSTSSTQNLLADLVNKSMVDRIVDVKLT